MTPKRQLQGAFLPLRPSFPALRATKTFTCCGVMFREGMLVNPDSDLARAIFREYPAYLQPARLTEEE